MSGISRPFFYEYNTNNMIFDYLNPEDLAVMMKTSRQYYLAIKKYIEYLCFQDFKDYERAFNPCVKILDKLDPLGNKNEGNIFDRCCRLKEKLPNHPESRIAEKIIDRVQRLREPCKKPKDGVECIKKERAECIKKERAEWKKSVRFYQEKFKELPKLDVPIISDLLPFESLVAVHQWRCSYYMHPTLSIDWKIEFSVSCRPLDPFDDARETLDPFLERCLFNSF